jgi:hypothetical protein
MARATALSLILLACGAAILAAASPASAATPCWKQVVDDWSQDGNIDGTYSASCIDEALAKVPEDIRAYSDFEEQAKAARIAAGRTLQSAGGSGGTGSGSEPDGTAAGEDTQQIQQREPETGPKDETPIQSVLGTHGNNADSIPLPLLILLGLAAALITAGGVGFGARKLRARRPAG